MKKIKCLLGFHKMENIGKNGDFDVFKCKYCPKEYMSYNLLCGDNELIRTEDGCILRPTQERLKSLGLSDDTLH